MAFTPNHEPQRFVQSPPPVLPGSETVHYNREIARLTKVINNLAEAVKEMQDYLKTLP